ncbi:hypothetical protein ACFVH6_22090 [Spirillospora sp. NPDC127200]
MRWPKNGVAVCPRHGGHAPQVVAAAERRKQEAEAAAAVATFGLPRDVDPGTALLEEVQRTAGHVAWLGQMVAALETGEVVWGVVEETDRPVTEKGGGLEVKQKAQPHTWVQLYQQERRHLASVAKAAIDAGVSERVVRVMEQVGATYIQVIDQILNGLDLSEAQQRKVPELMRTTLTTLTAIAEETST